MPKCAKVQGTLSSRSNLFKRLAGLLRVCRTSLGRFQTARKLLALWALTCACDSSDLKCAKVRDLTVSNDSQARNSEGSARRTRTLNHPCWQCIVTLNCPMFTGAGNRSLSKRSYTVFNVDIRFCLSSKAQILQFCSIREITREEKIQLVHKFMAYFYSL